MVFRELRRICFYFDNGKDLKQEFGLSDSGEKFVLKVCELLLKTNFLSEEVKLYLKEPSLSYEDISDILGVNYHTLKARFRSENIKINKLLGKQLDVIYSGNEPSQEEILKTMSLIEYNIKKYGASKENLNELLMIPIQRIPFDETTDIDDEAFQILCKELIDLSVSFARVKEESVTTGLKAYFNKLNWGTELTEVDIRRREKLISILKRN